MSDTRERWILDQRLALQNPYAYSEELAELRAVHAARRQAEDPYAFMEHLEADQAEHTERFPLAPASRQAASPDESSRKSDTQIEEAVRNLHRMLWSRRLEFFDPANPPQPIDLLDPELAFHLLGYKFELVDSLGQLYETARPIKVAGLIDKDAKTVLISSAYAPSTRRFTAAHELGHAVMHEFAGMHRDRPADSASYKRPWIEVEADKFAAEFLMPRNLLKREFEARFGKTPFTLNDATRAALVEATSDRSGKNALSLRMVTRLLSSSDRLLGRSFLPLSALFRVSVESMAIRLEEIGLVDLTNHIE